LFIINCIWKYEFTLKLRDLITEYKQEVEKVQRRATKLIPSISHLPYKIRLKFLRLPSLDFRRRRGNMNHVFKIINGMDRLDPHNFFICQPNNNTRGHSKRVFNGRCRGSVFSQRTVHDWNCLPEHVISCASLNSLKSNLVKFWKGKCYRLPWYNEILHSINSSQKDRNTIIGIAFKNPYI